MEFLIFWLGLATVTAIAASSRGRSGVAWFFLGFLFSVFALIAVLVMPPLLPGQTDARASRSPAPSHGYPREGEVLRYYKGHAIRSSRALSPVGARVAGREFENENLAHNWIDAQESEKETAAASARNMRRASHQPETSTGSAPAMKVIRLLGDGHFDQFVAGTSTFQPQIAALDRPQRRKFLVTLQPEPGNPHDANAVAVRHEGKTLGYLPGDDAQAYHDDLAEAGHPGATTAAWARIVGGGPETPTLGIRLDLAWPIELSKIA